MRQRDVARGSGATGARSAVPAAPVVVPVPQEEPVPSAPHEPPALDARARARAGLAAGRSPSLWWVCAGVVAVLVVSSAVGATQGALVLAGLLALSAVARAVLRPGPVALTVRSRLLDTTVLAGFAVAVGLLSQLVPTR